MVNICYYSTNRDLVKIGLVNYKSPFYTFICVLGFKTEMGYSQNFFIFDGVPYWWIEWWQIIVLKVLLIVSNCEICFVFNYLVICIE
jgi:hypothetical protein